MARAHGITDEGLLPIPCGMMVHPITDSSKIGENMKLPLEKTKRIIGKKLKALFPTWHNDFFRDERFPDLILQIDSDLQHVRNNEVLKKDISTKPKVMYRNTSQCSKQVVAVREGNLSVYVWS